MKIALDESGNSGQNLMIADEPILTLASVLFSDDQLAAAENHFSRVKAAELKFSQFRRNTTNMNLFMGFAELDCVNGDTVRFNVTHKKYFAVTKLVDLIYEPLARRDGHDLYEQGASLAIANVLVTTLPVYLGDSGFTGLLTSFVDLVRKPEEDTAKRFFDETVKAHKTLEEGGFNQPFNILDAALMGAHDPEFWIQYVSDTELDPLVPSYFTTIDFWGQKLQADFVVVSDESKALSKHLDQIRKLSDPNIQSRRLPSVGGGYAQFPYRSVNVSGAESKSDRSIQIADLFAGAAYSTFAAISRHQPLEPWQERFRTLCYEKSLLLGGYWPSAEVTPEELGAEHVTGEKTVDFVESILRSSSDQT
ncbi:MAG: DUF3800 domain-containing protein [Verrucomicrobiales bacterium]